MLGPEVHASVTCVGFTNYPHSLICRKATRLVSPRHATRQNGDVAFLSVSCTKAGFSNAFSFYGSAPGARPGGCTLPCRGVHHARRPDTARPNRYVSCGDSTLCGGSTRVRSVLLLRTGQPEDTSPFHTVLYRTEYRTISLPSRQHTHLSYWIKRAELSRMHARR